MSPKKPVRKQFEQPPLGCKIRRNGYTPWNRKNKLCAGLTDCSCIEFILGETLGVHREWSREFTTAQISWHIHEAYSNREIPITPFERQSNWHVTKRALADLAERGVIDRKPGARRGFWSYRVALERWEYLRDYVPESRRCYPTTPI